MKLETESLATFSSEVLVPRYDRSLVSQSVVHIGVGGFHRAHQAMYTEKLLNLGQGFEWGICGVGLRAEDRVMRDALVSQDYLYTLCELSDTDDSAVQVVGAIGDFLLAEESPNALIEKMALPQVCIVSLTITEGGYCTDDSTGQFNSGLPQIRHDLENPQAPKTVFGFLAESLARRKEAGLKPFTVMSCDNVPHNGVVAQT